MKPWQIGALRAVILVAIVVWPLRVLVLILGHAPDVPYWDEWDLIGLLEAWKLGKLEFSHFWAVHTDHRLPFTNLLFLADYAWFNGNRLPLLVFQWGVQGLLWAACVWRARQAFTGSLGLGAVAALASFLLFDMAAAEVWLWAFAIQQSLALLAFVAAVFALVDGWLVASLVLAVLATLSSASGLLAWPALALVALLQRAPARVWAALAVVGAATVAVYFTDYHPLPKPASFQATRLDQALYALIFLGGPLGLNGVKLSGALGALGLAGWLSLVALFWRWRNRPVFGLALPWLVVSCYPLGAAVLTGLGRAGFGRDSALAGRYIYNAAFFWLVLVVLGALALRELPRRLPRVPVTVLLAAMLVLGYTTGQTFLANRLRFGDMLSLASNSLWLKAYNPDIWNYAYPRAGQLQGFMERYRAVGIEPLQRASGDLVGKTLVDPGPLALETAPAGRIGAVGPMPPNALADKAWPAAYCWGEVTGVEDGMFLALTDEKNVIVGFGTTLRGPRDLLPITAGRSGWCGMVYAPQGNQGLRLWATQADGRFHPVVKLQGAGVR